jgi:hypothetical protein
VTIPDHFVRHHERIITLSVILQIPGVKSVKYVRVVALPGIPVGHGAPIVPPVPVSVAPEKPASDIGKQLRGLPFTEDVVRMGWAKFRVESPKMHTHRSLLDVLNGPTKVD